jgi:hypothetical protein
VLGRLGVTQATLFVLSIRNTNVSGKAPEGEPYGGAVDTEHEDAPATEGANKAADAPEKSGQMTATAPAP